MQDPSQGVAGPLQNHIHLISGHRFPLIGNLTLEQASRYLLDAPSIVKQIAPMSWTYVQAPQDGTLFLEWLSPSRPQSNFPSDGYAWADQPESMARQDFNGYTIEMMYHNLGYRHQQDPLASHARTRYHLVAKNPNVNAPPPDPSLWIVHYHQADPNRVMPVNSIPIQSINNQNAVQRRWLENQGRIEKKDFMLHDREHWPTINLPSMQHQPSMAQPSPGFPPNPYAPLQQPQQSMQQRAGFPQPRGDGPGPIKRQRTGTMAAPGDSAVHDTSIEDEENTALGDFFDHLTPRDISMARYMQHHRWMEEVFSSPYASAQIVPPDLGLGLTGELKGLTEGLLEPPTAVDGAEVVRSGKPKEAAFTSLTKEQVEEFGRRVQKHLYDGQADIDRMKQEHAEKMAEWRKTSVRNMRVEDVDAVS